MNTEKEREQNIKTDWKTCSKFKITVASREEGRTGDVAKKRGFGFY